MKVSFIFGSVMKALGISLPAFTQSTTELGRFFRSIPLHTSGSALDITTPFTHSCHP